MMQTNLPTRSALLRERAFRLFFVSRAVSLFGDSIHAIAVMVLVYAWTSSPAALGNAMFFLLAPKIVFGLVAGVVVDAWDRKRIMIAADLYRGVAVATIPFLPSLVSLYLILVTLAAAETFYNTARASVLPVILSGKERLVAGNALLQTATTVLMIAGPIAGGLLVASQGTTTAFLLDAATFWLAAFYIMRMEVPRQERAGGQVIPGRAWGDLREGIRAMIEHRTLWFLTWINGLILGAVFLTSSLTVAIAARVFAPEGFDAASIFGYINGAGGLGSLLGGLMLPWVSRHLPVKRVIIFGFLLASLELFCFALSRNLALILTAVTISNVGFVMASVSSVTVLQLNVSDVLRGRVIALYGVAISAVTSAAVAVGGWYAAVAGLQVVYLTAGAACVVATALGGWLGMPEDERLSAKETAG